MDKLLAGLALLGTSYMLSQHATAANAPHPRPVVIEPYTDVDLIDPAASCGHGVCPLPAKKNGARPRPAKTPAKLIADTPPSAAKKTRKPALPQARPVHRPPSHTTKGKGSQCTDEALAYVNELLGFGKAPAAHSSQALPPGQYGKAIKKLVPARNPNSKHKPHGPDVFASAPLETPVLPLSDMRCGTTSNDEALAQGRACEAELYSRLTFAPSRSRLRAQADKLRGDLAITPILPGLTADSISWFRPSVEPARDLDAGASHIIFDSRSGAETQAIINRSKMGDHGIRV